METKDLIVIGGGINGAGIAADAAGRGLSVLMLGRRISLVRPLPPVQNSFTVACATLSTMNSAWSARRWLNVKCY